MDKNPLFLLLTLVLVGSTGSQTAGAKNDSRLARRLEDDEGEDQSAYRCRSRNNHWSVKAYELETCAMCYSYMPANQFVEGGKWGRVPSGLVEDGEPVPMLINRNGTETVRVDGMLQC